MLLLLGLLLQSLQLLLVRLLSVLLSVRLLGLWLLLQTASSRVKHSRGTHTFSSTVQCV
jgi:hypothetical protein